MLALKQKWALFMQLMVYVGHKQNYKVNTVLDCP
jgi:hypothetical protein